MRYSILALALLLGPALPARTQAQVGVGVSVGVEVPGMSIGINVPAYPDLVPVPGYPVYYAPRAETNYFFYDGLYWVFVRDGWYASSWYDGPWRLVRPDRVPLYVLRVPVRYYRAPPPWFRGWAAERPPRWGQRWGRDWERRHEGWERWDRRAPPRAAPLPLYQREYAGDRYPRGMMEQHDIRAQHYRHEPRESFTRQEFRGPPRAAPGRPPGPQRMEPGRDQPGRDQPGEGHGHGRGRGRERD